MISFLLACAIGMQKSQATAPPLSPGEIAEKLKPIPVFIPVGEDNAPVTAAQKGQQTIGVFFGKEECEKFVAGLKKQPGMDKVHVFAGSFGSLATPKGTTTALIPVEAEKIKALEILKQDKADAKEFPGVPLFFVVGKDGNFLTVTQKDSTLIPLMFSWQEAEDMRKRAMGNVRDGSTFTVKVTALEQIIKAMQVQPAANTRNLVFVPNRKSIEDYNKLAKPPGG
ncbi:MAG: hypothetical protein BGO01_20330 [Armatimonadetes bacterium 55-13]|nr:hypothetical protein [Armatimonadota bacterium]OJU64460.1 MAG: hypothetical protein BGO01_20330 [Armatimonadetes bacterium 55-13]